MRPSHDEEIADLRRAVAALARRVADLEAAARGAATTESVILSPRDPRAEPEAEEDARLRSDSQRAIRAAGESAITAARAIEGATEVLARIERRERRRTGEYAAAVPRREEPDQ